MEGSPLKIVAAVQNKSPQAREEDGPSLTVNLGEREHRILQIMAAQYGDGEDQLIRRLLSHALSETILHMPEILGDSYAFDLFEERLIKQVGMGFYLSLSPVFPFAKAVDLADHAEVHVTEDEIVYGRWQYVLKELQIKDPSTGETMYRFPQGERPRLAGDGMGMLWRGVHVRALYTEEAPLTTFAQDMEDASAIWVNKGTYQKLTHGIEQGAFRSYANSKCDESLLACSDGLITLEELSDGSREVDFTKRALMAARQSPDGKSWLIGSHVVTPIRHHPILMDAGDP